MVSALKRRGGQKSGSWEALAGYTVEALERHLRRTMPEGYDWSDFLAGRLHIEHRIPLAAFNFTDAGHIDFRRAWALGNLRLFPGPDNIEKGTKLAAPFQPSFAI